MQELLLVCLSMFLMLLGALPRQSGDSTAIPASLAVRDTVRLVVLSSIEIELRDADREMAG
jgi:hypothetical protein